VFAGMVPSAAYSLIVAVQLNSDKSSNVTYYANFSMIDAFRRQ
jgi:hypothetical protein